MLGLGYDRKGNTIRFFPVRTLAQQILPHRNLSTMFLVSGTPPRYCANEIATTLTPRPSSVFDSISLVGGDSTSSANDNDLINYCAALAALVLSRCGLKVRAYGVAPITITTRFRETGGFRTLSSSDLRHR